jgi:hypothetical protein
MKPDTRKALNTLIASAFNRSTDSQKDAAVDDAFAKLKRDGEILTKDNKS